MTLRNFDNNFILANCDGIVTFMIPSRFSIILSFHLENITWQVVGQAITVSDCKHTAANEMTFTYFLRICQMKKKKKKRCTNINNRIFLDI